VARTIDEGFGIATDHSYSDKRIALETAVLDWLASLL